MTCRTSGSVCSISSETPGSRPGLTWPSFVSYECRKTPEGERSADGAIPIPPPGGIWPLWGGQRQREGDAGPPGGAGTDGERPAVHGDGLPHADDPGPGGADRDEVGDVQPDAVVVD